MFQACTQLEKQEALDLIQSLRSKMPTSFYSNPRLLTSLIDAFVKCGDVQRAEEVFKKIDDQRLANLRCSNERYVCSSHIQYMKRFT